MTDRSYSCRLQSSTPSFNYPSYAILFQIVPLSIYKTSRALLLLYVAHPAYRSFGNRLALPITTNPLPQPNYHTLLVSSPPLCSVFESLGHLSIMSETLRKRDREHEALLDSIDAGEPKRFHREETGRFLHLLELDKTLSDYDEEECAPSEELLNGVMKILEEEIAATCSTSYNPSNSGDKSAAAYFSSGHKGQTRDLISRDSRIDLCYLVEASDDELGIPPNLELQDEVCQTTKDTSDGFSESTDLKSLGENWHFEDDFDNYQQYAVSEDAWDANQLQDCKNRDYVSQGILFDGDFSAAWRPETTGGM